MTTVWVTRTQGETTAQAIRARGYEAIIAPVLETRFLSPDLSPDVNTTGYDAVIVTSQNGVASLARLTGRRDVTAWCVGDATAAAAHAAGFAAVISAGGDAKTLFDAVKTQAPRTTRFFYAAPAEPSAPLTAWLRAEGFAVSQIAVYETHTITPALSPGDLARISHILIHSARGGQAVAAFLLAHGKLAFTNSWFICISDSAWQGMADVVNAQDKSLLSGIRRRISPLPTEASMLNLIDGDAGS